MSTVKMVHEIDGIFMKLIKIAQQTMTKEQLKTVLDKTESKKLFFKILSKNYYFSGTNPRKKCGRTTQT